MFSVAPTFIVIFAIPVLAPNVTALVPVVAMTTSSPAAGIMPPTHVDAVVQVPPAAVLVLVAAFEYVADNSKKEAKATLKIFEGSNFGKKRKINNLNMPFEESFLVLKIFFWKEIRLLIRNKER